MTGPLARRPLPALIALLALLVLTALVWWRVLHRGGGQSAEASPTQTTCPSAPAPSATLPAPERITVHVLNATKRSGIAGRARTTLAGAGFNVPKPAANDNPKKKIPGVAEIRFARKWRSEAVLLRYYVPGAKLVPIHTKSAVVVLSLGQKYHGIKPAAAVHTALTHKRIAVASPPPLPSGAAGPSTASSPTISC